jgi:superfamily II DNA or RNA helicase
MYQGRHVGANGQVKNASKSVMIESPTGSGKTSMALLAAKALQSEIPELVVGWVAMRRNLLQQAEAENRDKEINVENIQFISMFENKPKLVEQRVDKKLLLIVDESQHDAASSMTHLHNILKPDFVLGMTATPFRTDRVKLCFDSVVTDIGIHQLIQSDYLSKFHHYTIDQFNVDTVATHYISERQRWGKSIFYFLTHDECESLAMKLRSADVTCEVVTGSSDVESQLAGFRNGNVQCLINCMKLTEGFNDPSLRTAWVRDSSRGPTIQMAGRAFRKFEGVEYKQVVQSKNTDWPIIRTAIPDEQYQWSVDSWRMLKINPAIEQITQNCRMAIASMDVKLPPMLGKLKTERRRINRDRRV